MARAIMARGLLLFSLSSSWGWAAPVEDSVRAQARTLAYAGVEAYAIENYRGASEKLGESFRLFPVPSVGLWSARALVKLGQLAQAEARYRAVCAVSLSPGGSALQRNAYADAEHELGELAWRVPRVTIEIDGAAPSDVDVRIDGSVQRALVSGRAHPLDPGRHTIVGTRGSESTKVVVDVVEGDRKQVRLSFAPFLANASRSDASVTNPASLESQLRVGAWAALTAGGAGLTTSLAAYLLARQQLPSNEPHERCADSDCSPAAVAAYDTWRRVHLVGLVSGVVFGAAGVSLLVISQRQTAADESSGVALEIGPASAVLRGRF